MRPLLALIVLGQALDALTFALFYHVAPQALVVPVERGGITASLLAAGGVALVAAIKVGVPALIYVTFAHRSYRRDHRWAPHVLALRNVALTAAAASGFLGMAFNLYAVAIVIS